MSLNDEVRALRDVALFARVEPAKLRQLAFSSERIRYGAGEALFYKGDEGDSAYVVLSGRAEVLVASAAGEIKVADLGVSALVGELAAFGEGIRTATVRAAEPLEVLRIGRGTLVQLLLDNPTIAIEIIRELARRLGATTADMIEARSALAALRPD